MNATNDDPLPVSATNRASRSDVSPRLAPSPADRAELGARLQARALAHSNPLTANLEVITGDLMLFAYRQKEILEAKLANAQNALVREEEFAKDAERYLRLVRQAD